MPYKVCRIQSAAQLDSLPVAVITRYPLEPRDYKPYAQCTLCLYGQELLLRMWAFEVSPPEGSELRALLYIFSGQPDAAFCVTMRPEERCEFSLCSGGIFTPVEPPPGFRLRPHSGEDLQGVYWGGTAALPLGWLDCLCGGMTALSAGTSFAGNFYKLCSDARFKHSGSFFPADFPDNPFSPRSTGGFSVVSY